MFKFVPGTNTNDDVIDAGKEMIPVNLQCITDGVIRQALNISIYFQIIEGKMHFFGIFLLYSKVLINS